MSLDHMVRGFYVSLVIGAIGAVIWGFTVAFDVIPQGGDAKNAARYSLLAFWVVSFLAASFWYAVKEPKD